MRATAVVQRDIATARALGTTGAPTFLAGKVLSDGRIKVTTSISGSEPIRVFRRALEAALR
jgi:predicted DsbA family dithiol-disulfide isomerase